MKHILILFAILLASSTAFSQGSVVTIASGSEIVVGAGAQFCADTINVYGTLNCASLACICPHNKVNCYGTCIPPELSGNNPLISGPPNVDFGNVKVGESQDRLVDIVNTGTSALHISSTSSTPSQFTITMNGGARTLQPNESLSITLTFSPSVEGSQSGSFTIVSDAENSPVLTIPLTGVGTLGKPLVEANPTSVDFGSVKVNQTKNEVVVISNTGQYPLVISSTSITPAQFAISFNGEARTLQPNESVSIILMFMPAAEGELTGTFTVNSDANNTPVLNIPLQGVGTVDGPIAEIDPMALNFGSVNTGLTKPLSVSIHNAGERPLHISNESIAGTDASDFSISGPAAGDIAGGSTATLEITFSPSSVGTKVAVYVCGTNDPAQPSVIVTLEGTGVNNQPAISVTPLTYNFGATAPNTPLSGDIRITNTGSQDLVLSAQQISGQGFSVQTPAGTTIAPSVSSTAKLRFNPTSEGQYQGQFVITSNDPSTPTVTVLLTGSCTSSSQCLSVTPFFLSFPETATNSSSTKSLTVMNSCPGSIQMTASITGASFSLATPSNVDIGGGTSAQTTVEFRPPTLGQHNGTLKIATTNPTQSIDVSLVGTSTTTAVERLPGVPDGIVLRQNYPNPFNPSTEIVYELDRSALVRLDVYSVHGGQVATLVDERQQPGVYRTEFDAYGLQSGLYAAVLRVTDPKTQYIRTVIMTLLK